MVADREEYIVTDDDGLAPEFFAEAPRGTNRRHYKKSTTKIIRDGETSEDYDSVY